MVRIIDKIIQRRKQYVTLQYPNNEQPPNNNNNNNNQHQEDDDDVVVNGRTEPSPSTTGTTTTTTTTPIPNDNWFYSFEFFPPKTEAGLDNLITRIDRMVQRLDPFFIDITWSQFRSAANTMAIATYVQKYTSVDVLLHLSTVQMNEEQLVQILQQAQSGGIQNILALRGDPPRGKRSWLPQDTSGGHCDRAIDLVRFIRERYGNTFGIAVAGHPEGHPSSTSRHDELVHLKDKMDAGADLIITQLFYDVTIFQKYVQECRAYGITCPIIPGIMPIQSYSSFQRMTEYCQVSVPPHVWEQLEPVREDDEAVKRVGCQIATDMCRQILSFPDEEHDDANNHNCRIDGIHFYTLNLERSVTHILNLLGVIDIVPSSTAITRVQNDIYNSNSHNHNDNKTTNEGSQPMNQIHPMANTVSSSLATTVRAKSSGRMLPWRPSAIERRHKYEQVRPINWANRPKSYVVRTEDWDEFPNGRWGDATSPAFGELSDVSHFYSFSLGSDDDQRAMLGHHPKTPADVYEVFAKYVEGKIPHIPWCETTLQPESFLIQKKLSQLNRSGYLTINSQPSVNGAPSSHKTFGWGGPGGYVYQKAYCECFCSPEHTQQLVAMVKQHKSMNLYAVNVTGDQIQEGVELGGVTALTWGVFPNREILQPTIFDPSTFIVWSEEAFSLWTFMWMNLYDYDSTSYTLIETIRDTYYLCAIIDNDYVSSTSTIWDAMPVELHDESSL